MKKSNEFKSGWIPIVRETSDNNISSGKLLSKSNKSSKIQTIYNSTKTNNCEKKTVEKEDKGFDLLDEKYKKLINDYTELKANVLGLKKNIKELNENIEKVINTESSKVLYETEKFKWEVTKRLEELKHLMMVLSKESEEDKNNNKDAGIKKIFKNIGIK
ncbi:hypothetical protein RBH29_09445 [Herbivorax sp. ANBcel31]|uniref:hypothetical protein n=1 Tax=Herbivorax sp. ANBcel31 TaxID=3069754 RepID=UPI0027B48E7B|nr:hypothetical protein [Herbivorax sp. ANBcel31]MDQ2086647.1 hypothetical protein [Herbivorax sp. ANBcel31]